MNNEIPDAYKDALLHAVKPKTSWDEQLAKWNRDKKETRKDLIVTRTNFFVPYSRDEKKI